MEGGRGTTSSRETTLVVAFGPLRSARNGYLVRAGAVVDSLRELGPVRALELVTDGRTEKPRSSARTVFSGLFLALRHGRAIRGARAVFIEGCLFAPVAVVARLVGTPVVFDAHCFQEREIPAVAGTPQRSSLRRAMLGAFNFACARLASLTICPSTVEASYAVRAYGVDPSRVAVVPNVISMRSTSGEASAGRRGQGPPAGGRHTVLFVGDLNAPHNLDALLWIRSTLAPAAGEDTVIWVAGTMPRQGLHVPSNVVLLGFVEGLGALYERADLFIAPLRFGSGVKTKVLDAMAAGIPVLASPVAMEGIDLPPGHGSGVAVSGLEEFPSRMRELLSRPALLAEMRGAGISAMHDRHSPQAFRRAIASAVGAVGLILSGDANVKGAGPG